MVSLTVHAADPSGGRSGSDATIPLDPQSVLTESVPLLQSLVQESIPSSCRRMKSGGKVIANCDESRAISSWDRELVRAREVPHAETRTIARPAIGRFINDLAA